MFDDKAAKLAGRAGDKDFHGFHFQFGYGHGPVNDLKLRLISHMINSIKMIIFMHEYR